jgi:hypothetical protein
VAASSLLKVRRGFKFDKKTDSDYNVSKSAEHNSRKVAWHTDQENPQKHL